LKNKNTQILTKYQLISSVFSFFILLGFTSLLYDLNPNSNLKLLRVLPGTFSYFTLMMLLLDLMKLSLNLDDPLLCKILSKFSCISLLLPF